MAIPFSFDIFLSHNAEDKTRVRRIAERLRAGGVRVWFDEWVIKPGDDIYLAIEHGLEAAHTLVLCLSPAALGSDWVGLERNTVLFRDPSNAGRRFIPILLADCILPDTLRRYKYVDFRQETDAAFEELLAACQSERVTPSPQPQVKPEKTAKSTERLEQYKPLLVQKREFTGHEGWIRSVVIDPDGAWLVSNSWDDTIKIWDIDKGECQATLAVHAEDADFLTVTPEGGLILSSSADKAIHIWDSLNRKRLKSLHGHLQNILDVAVDQRGRRLISASSDHTLKVWGIDSGACILSLLGHTDQVRCVALARDNRWAASGSSDKKVKIWNLKNGECITTLQGHSGAVNSVKITPDGKFLVSASQDATIRIWNLETSICIGTLEGHKSSVDSLAISPEGDLIASKGLSDESLRIWDRRSGACLRIFEDDERSFCPISLAFSPNGKRLISWATASTYNFSLYFLDLEDIRAAPPAVATRRYVNAKVVLVGESGVGKSGLAHRLIEDKFVQTHSTHGMQVWRLDLPLELEEDLEREALLWDLAGQEDYRLIHQLFLDETALALLLFNPQNTDPFHEVGLWLKVLRSAVSKDQSRDIAKLLIAARADVGGIKISERKLRYFLEEHGLAAYLSTSAKRGDNCSDEQNEGNPSALKELIAKHIPWSQLPWTSAPRLLTDLKSRIIEMKEETDISLIRFAELAQRLKQAMPRESFGESDVRTVLTLLSNHGLVIPLKFGDLVLLRPEVLNGYAAAVIRAARDHIDDIGCIREQAVFDRMVDFEGVDRLDPSDEELLMRAIIQTFLDKSLCIAEDTPEGRHLIFPSQYRRERPIPQHPEIFVSYTFSGEWQTVYTTLVVRLWYSREFQHRELWRNAAEFETSKGHTAGLLMDRMFEGEGTISVFFDIGVPDELKVIFIEYVRRHLDKYASDVRRDRRYVCPKCAKPVANLEAVRVRIEAGKDFIYCQWCDDEKIPLVDHIERLASDPVARRVLGMDSKATRELDSQALEQILIGHMMAVCGEASQIFREINRFDYGIIGELEFTDDSGTPSGSKAYVQLKIGAFFLHARKADGKELFDVKNLWRFESLTEQLTDVYLVIRDAEGTIRWMNVARYLNERTESEQDSRQIAFEGEKLDAPAVWRVRDRFRFK